MPFTPIRISTPPKAYSYIRFSTPQQAKGDSHTRQNDKAARYAAEHELVLDTALNLTDLGVSAYRGKNTCCGMPAASSSPTTATTLAPSKPISATDRSCPRCATRP